MVLNGRMNKIHIIDYRRLRVMGNLEKLDAMKELMNDWSIIGRQQDDTYFPTYSTCDIGLKLCNIKLLWKLTLNEYV